MESLLAVNVCFPLESQGNSYMQTICKLEWIQMGFAGFSLTHL